MVQIHINGSKYFSYEKKTWLLAISSFSRHIHNDFRIHIRDMFEYCYGRPLLQAWLLPYLTLSQTSPGFYGRQYKSFENTAGKGETACNKQFLLFPQCFLPVKKTFCHFLSKLKFSSANAFCLEESKICCLGKG